MFPTYVGMNRLCQGQTVLMLHVPHIRGDEPHHRHRQQLAKHQHLRTRHPRHDRIPRHVLPGNPKRNPPTPLLPHGTTDPLLVSPPDHRPRMVHLPRRNNPNGNRKNNAAL